ncbi:sterol desaturase family protein [Chitinophagaceae bacterium LB-8]|uniref:Sterol desaturase family protein n=1 Tax=Paraflavisolibacter caeni TaxID=2982496 RepID=A0A9X2XWD9_9BACT|nr:sterol desaturase family protein [Paraflavisolibacter caeni]MCU7550290.1 sterol desaturase family protein [Paraflavisolibacter caeni]
MIEFDFLTSLFGAPEISFDNMYYIEKKAPNIIIWAAPVMFFFVLLEWFISRLQHRHLYEKRETFASVCVGIGNVVINTTLKLSIFYLIIWLYNILPWRMHFNWWTFIPCYIIFDFCSYWAHRISHQQRFWWATHVVHHSAEHYNLTVSFRLSWVQNLKLIFFLPVSLMGFHPVIFFVVNQVAVLFQFWVHTEYIPRLHPLVEYVFATPSNHRVHHGSQEKYINKNYGATFIIWDRIFGTYQKEEEQAIYGLTHQLEDKSNPFYVNFHEYIDIWKDLKGAKGLRKKMFYVFGDPINIARDKTSNSNEHSKIDKES